MDNGPSGGRRHYNGPLSPNNLHQQPLQCDPGEYYTASPGDHLLLCQVGSNWALTAAHCLYSRETGKVRPAASLEVLPGLHQRSRPGLALR